MELFLYNKDLDLIKDKCSPLFLQCAESYMENSNYYIHAVIKYNGMMSANPNLINANLLWEVFWATGDEGSLQKLWFYKNLYLDRWNNEMNYYLGQNKKLDCWESVVSRHQFEPVDLSSDIQIEPTVTEKPVKEQRDIPDRVKLKKIISEKMNDTIKKIEIKMPNHNTNKTIVNKRKINRK